MRNRIRSGDPHHPDPLQRPDQLEKWGAAKCQPLTPEERWRDLCKWTVSGIGTPDGTVFQYPMLPGEE